MGRLVDVDKLKDEVENIFWYEDEDMCKVLDLLDQAPTIDPVKHGYWKEADSGSSFWRCSECNYGVSAWNNTRYCPNCGAKMDKEVTE